MGRSRIPGIYQDGEGRWCVDKCYKGERLRHRLETAASAYDSNSARRYGDRVFEQNGVEQRKMRLETAESETAHGKTVLATPEWPKDISRFVDRL
jgi:hypothetical protein